MRTKTAKSLLCIVLAFLLVPIFGCRRGEGPENPEDSSGSTAQSAVLVADGNTTPFTVIRSESASPFAIKQASAVFSALSKYAGSAKIASDWEKNYEAVADEIEGRFEILVGKTNRPQSAQAAQGLAYNEYKVTRIGNKIVLVGGSDRALADAAEAFIAALRMDGDKVFFDAELTGTVEKQYLIALTDQKNSKVEVFDLALGNIASGSEIWSHTYPEYNIADTRLREYNGKDVVLAAFGGTCASMVDFESGKMLWSTTAAASNPHAAELLPLDGGYVIAVASSSGNEIRFFGLPSTVPSCKVALPDAHGLLWDPTLGVLFAVGESTLTAYEVRKSGSSVTVTERTDLSAEIPGYYAHDLQPVYGDPDKMFVTNNSSVFVYSKSSKTFSTSFEGADQVNRAGVKGIGIFDDGSIVFIYPDGAFMTWTSASVFLALRAGKSYCLTQIKSPNGGFYKVRVWNKNYQ